MTTGLVSLTQLVPPGCRSISRTKPDRRDRQHDYGRVPQNLATEVRRPDACNGMRVCGGMGEKRGIPGPSLNIRPFDKLCVDLG